MEKVSTLPKGRELEAGVKFREAGQAHILK